MTIVHMGIASLALAFLLLFIDAWNQKPPTPKHPRHWKRLEGPK